MLVNTVIGKYVYIHKNNEYMIKRDKYLNLLIESKQNGFPNVITGIRRCGKSYLLNTIYKNYLMENGVASQNIIFLDLTKISNAYYRDPIYLYEHVLKLTNNKNEFYYVILDEIQEVYPLINLALTDGEHIQATTKEKDIITFVDVILDLSSMQNIDSYVTGSNSKMLSSDIVTQFRDKATNIRVMPLSFEEIYKYKNIDENLLINDYILLWRNASCCT